MRLGQDVLSDLAVALSREWLLGNGLGGSASGTCIGANARRTHAHLVAAGEHGRLTTLLLRFEERLHTDEGALGLGTNLTPRGAPRRAGYRLLDEFRLDPWPVWRFRADGIVLEKSLFMIYGHNAIVVTYRQLAGSPARLTISPLVAARDLRDLQREDAAMRASALSTPGRVRIEAAGDRPILTLWHSGAFLPARAWQRVHYRSIGDDPEAEITEDAFVPGYLEAPIEAGGAFHLIASAEDGLMRALAQEDRLGSPPPRTLAGCIDMIERDERERVALWRAGAIGNAERTVRQAAAARGAEDEAAPSSEPVLDPADPWIAPLAEALRMGLVRRGRRLTLVRSLPGGAERGADTLRALGGLIALRGFETAREILRGYVEYLNEGLAPERFDPDDGTPRYGDPAVSLWLVIAAERYARRSQDVEFAKHTLYPALEGVMNSYRAGTTGGIHVDAEGLLAVGEGDAARPAALNALWHNATVAMAQLARTAGRRETGAFYLAWANDHLRRFNEVLWDESRGCLFEGMTDHDRIVGLDPSQLLAVSLTPPLLAGERALRLVETIERELLTPLGLRENVDDAHVSPVWLGPFCTALLRVHGRSAEAQTRVHGLFQGLHAGLEGTHLMPERFEAQVDSESAARPSGDGDTLSIVAAAELVRVWVEELDHARAPAPLEP